MKKTVLYSLTVLALVLGLTLAMVAPVMAGEIGMTKDRVPDEAPYYVGQTIYFVMSVTNPEGNPATNTLTRIWDTLPNGTVIEFLGPGETLVQLPGQTNYFNAQYKVRAQDMIWIPALDDYGVRNRFEAEGYDSYEDDVYALVISNTRVIDIPPVGGQAFPIGRLAVLAFWIGLAAIIAGAVIFVRRRRAES